MVTFGDRFCGEFSKKSHSGQSCWYNVECMLWQALREIGPVHAHGSSVILSGHCAACITMRGKRCLFPWEPDAAGIRELQIGETTAAALSSAKEKYLSKCQEESSLTQNPSKVSECFQFFFLRWVANLHSSEWNLNLFSCHLGFKRMNAMPFHLCFAVKTWVLHDCWEVQGLHS